MSTPGSLSRVGEVAVIGGGIAGCTVAYELAGHGVDVTLVEQGAIASAASGLNAGLLLNQIEPDVVRIMQRSLEIYRGLVEAGGDTFDFRPVAQVLLARDASQLELTEARVTGMQAIGVRVDPIAISDLRRELPQLAPEVAGAYVVPEAWALTPAAATSAFADAARARGAEIRTGVRATRIEVSGGRLAGIATDQGSLACDAVVIAAGPWLPVLLPGMPITAGRGWLMRTGRLPFRLPWVLEEMSWPDQDVLGRAARPPRLADVAGGHDRPVAEAFVMVPLPAGDALIGTSLSPSLRSSVEGVEMPRRLAGRALEVAPGLADLEVLNAWSGVRPMTPDGMPVVGAAGPDGVFVHGGHGSLGMMAAPATARWLVAEILDGAPPPELVSLRPDRFV
jgi:glycine/D-amino acid oxidase-like deaminating enzyme